MKRKKMPAEVMTWTVMNLKEAAALVRNLQKAIKLAEQRKEGFLTLFTDEENIEITLGDQEPK